MYPVSANFHTLSTQDSPKTRVRIYFIGDAVDCTDDNDVQTNGTLLVGAVGDADSNGRIGQNGVVFNELFNPDKNIQIGRAVSSQIGMTLLNTDGALDNFQYGRCKVYLDVYDAANTTWLACPMGVYIIELPTKRKAQLINAVGFDQMTKLDAICDTWWNSLNWSGGLTLLQIVNSMAAQFGVSVSSNTASAIVNGSLSFTAAPFDCVEATYREVLEIIAEATGTVARFDRNGALDLRYFYFPQISGNDITINTDTVGNQCLSIDIAEYTVTPIDLLRAKFAEGDIGVTLGSGTNEYVIQNNLFLNGANATEITNKLSPLRNRLFYTFTNNTPMTGRFIWDWSIEAGDVFYLVRDGKYYAHAMFQQTMTWRGGYVVSNLICDGDKTRPALDSAERDYYRLDSDMRTLVIEAPRINLLGYTTINNGFKVNLDGTFEANGAAISGVITAKSGNKTAEMSSGKFLLKNGSRSQYEVSYDTDTNGAELTMYDTSGNKTVTMAGSGGPATGIEIIDPSNNNEVAFSATIDGNVTARSPGNPSNEMTYSPSGGLSVNGNIYANKVAPGDSLGNITADGDVSVGGDLSITGSISGNVSATGTVSASDFLINGSSLKLKSYVDTTASNYTIGANNYVAVPYPTGLNGRNVVSIGMATWTSVSGAISIMPYGEANSNWYIIGNAGVALNGARFRYWYIDY